MTNRAARPEAMGPEPRPTSRRRLAGWLALLLVVVGALTFGIVDDGGTRSSGDRARNLAESIACPRCDGQSVADSDSDAAKGIRSVIERRIDEGASDAEIRDELAAAYGERVLLTPGQSGVSSLVWTLPVVALVAAFAGLAYAFRYWRGSAAARASDADRVLVARARRRTPGHGDGDIDATDRDAAADDAGAPASAAAGRGGGVPAPDR